MREVADWNQTNREGYDYENSDRECFPHLGNTEVYVEQYNPVSAVMSNNLGRIAAKRSDSLRKYTVRIRYPNYEMRVKTVSKLIINDNPNTLLAGSDACHRTALLIGNTIALRAGMWSDRV